MVQEGSHVSPDVSIHAPLQREGRHALLRKCLADAIVSIHAPLQREGRLGSNPAVGVRIAFQSTPPSKERGDVISYF